MSTPKLPKFEPINKLLLTPCRRPGLSRKVRTPLHPPSPQCQPLNIIKIDHDKELDHIKPVSIDPKDFTQNVKIDSRTRENSSKEIKKTVERDQVRGSRSNIIVNDEDKSLKSIKDNDKLNSKTERVSKSSNVFDKEIATLSSQKAEVKFSPEKLENLKDRGIIKHVNYELNHNISPELRVTVESCCEKVNSNEQIAFQSKSIEKKGVKSKKFFKRLSLKRSTSNNDSMSDIEDYPSPVESVQLETINAIASKAKKPRINDDDDVVDIKQDIITDIQHRIKVKKEKLRQLQQAATYKKIHNADELEKLIDVWKNGCRKALDQLHQKLQSHAPISMETLVQKFNVPEDVIDNSS